MLFLNGLLDMQLVQLIEYDLIKNIKILNIHKVCFLWSWLILIFQSMFGIFNSQDIIPKSLFVNAIIRLMLTDLAYTFGQDTSGQNASGQHAFGQYAFAQVACNANEHQ